MSSSQDKIITKKLHHEGVIQKRSNHVLYEIVDETQKLLIKGQKKEILKSKEKEILDNFRYLETKQIRINDERRKSIVKHKRLSSPIGKETPFMRNSFKEYKTKTSIIQKRPKLSNYEEKKTYIQKKNYSQENKNKGKNKFVNKRSSTPSQYIFYKRRGETSNDYNISKLSLNKNYIDNLKKNSYPNFMKNIERGKEFNKRKNQNIESDSYLFQDIKYLDEFNLKQNQNIEGNSKQIRNFKEGFDFLKNQKRERNNYNLGKNQGIEVSSNLYQNEIMKTGNNLGKIQDIEGASNIYQNNNLLKKCNILQNQGRPSNLYQNKILYIEDNYGQNQEIEGKFEERNYNMGKNYFGQNSINEQGVNNIYQSQCYGTYPKTAINLELNTYNKRNINQNHNLPIYLDSNENLYKSNTERLLYCECCGKPKRPKQYHRENNHQQVRKSISREIIAEESSKGDYVIKYNNKVNLNQPISSKFENQIKGSDNIYGFVENFSSPNADFCPIHGYI